MRRGSQPSPRTSTSEWVPLTATSSVNPIVATSDAHQHQQLQEQFDKPGQSTTPLAQNEPMPIGQAERVSLADESRWRAGEGNFRGTTTSPSVAAAYPYAAGGSTTYEPSPMNRFLKSKPARNTALIAFVLIILASLLHATQPEMVDQGYRVLSNAMYRNMGWKEKQEMISLDARLKDLLDRPALDQWQYEALCRHGCPFYTYSRNSMSLFAGFSS